MPTDLTVTLENRPGTLAELREATGAAGINLDASCGFLCEGRGVLHVLVEDAAGARRVIEDAGFETSDEREVLLLRQGTDIQDRPGAARAWRTPVSTSISCTRRGPVTSSSALTTSQGRGTLWRRSA